MSTSHARITVQKIIFIKNVVYKSISINAYYAHSENIIISMISNNDLT